MEIEHEVVDKTGVFRAFDEDGTALGSMVYVQAGPHKIVVQHTGVEGHARGMGVATALFEHMVAWVRENDAKVVARCPYTRRKLMEDPELKDILG